MRFLVMLLTFLAVLPGCATIIHGSNQDISISSNPPGATVLTADGGSFTTPAKINVKRNKDHVFCVTKPGFHTEQVAGTSVLSGAVFANIVLGGIIGGIVDASSGAAWRIEPETFMVTLRPLNPGEQQEAVSFTPLSPEQRLANLERLKNSGNITPEDYEATKKAIQEEQAKKAAPPATDG